MHHRMLRVPREIRDLIRHMHPELKRRVKSVLEVIVEDPEHYKALRDDLAGLRSARIGRLRLIYRVRNKVLEVVALGPRRTIYKETLRLVRREKRQ